MRNLINFIIKNVHWLFFLLLIVISGFLIVNNNEYQRSKYAVVENEIIGQIYSASYNIRSYVGLRDENEKLMACIAKQESYIQSLKSQLEEKIEVDTIIPAFALDSSGYQIYNFIPARVVNNSISKVENLMTLNKGSNDGVKIDMGVLTTDGLVGVVGVVINVSSHFSEVIPVLNPKLRLSCKVKGNNYFGPLVWNDPDIRYANLEQLPRHVEFQIGDTVVTSSYSAIFPEGIPVGTIVGSKKQKNDNFNSLKIKLFTNFGNLNHVLIVKNNKRAEQLELEKKSGNNGS